MSDARATALGIAVGFVPWILYWALAGSGRPMTGVLAGVVAAAALVARAGLRHRGAPIETAALSLFAGLGIVRFGFGVDLAADHSTLIAATLMAVAWGSLACQRPFTATYARASTPEALWKHPAFLRINRLLTTIWGAVFTVNTGLALVTLIRPGRRVLLTLVLPQAAIAGAVAASIMLPRWLPRRYATKVLAEQQPYRWIAPSFARRDDGVRDVVVVGSGIGGLTAAALLARRGLDVLVLEQHYLAGGFCTSWPRLVRRGDDRLRYVFDAGVHDVSGLGERGAVRNVLRALDLEHRLEWRRVGQEYVLPWVRLKIPHDATAFVTNLASVFPEERAAIADFFAEMASIYRELYADIESTGGVPEPPQTVDALLAWPERHLHAFRWMDVPFGVMLDRYFVDARLKATLSTLTGYLSADPRALTVAAMAPIFGFYFDGGWYPVGGSQALADALVDVVRTHGEVRLRTAVRRIVVERGRATGVVSADGTLHRARAVVSNADPRRTFIDLVGAEHMPVDFAAQIASLTPSTSALMVFLGIDFIPDVEPITIVSGHDFGLAIAIPSKVDPGLAPPGHAAVSLVALAPPDLATWNRRASGYGARRRAACDALVAAADRIIPGLARRVVYRQDATPATFARYAWTTGGAIYGPSIGQRLPVKSPVENLVLAGAGVFPGAGIEAVVISGTRAANTLCPEPCIADKDNLVTVGRVSIG